MNTISNENLYKITKELYNVYGDSNLGNKEDPLDELMFIVLTTKTSDKVFNQTYSSLLNTFGTWENVRKANFEAIQKVIKPGGLYKQKAKLIKGILQSIFDKNNRDLDLSFLNTYSDSEAETYLLSLNGVGIKTAKCVLLYSLRRNVLPVDTHTYRLAYELGLISETYMRNEKGKLHKMLEEIIPPECRYQFHVGAVMHGRREHTSRLSLGKCALIQSLSLKGCLK